MGLFMFKSICPRYSRCSSSQLITTDLQAAYGLSIKDYLTDLRMQKAQLLLRDEANTISEVAAQVGFDNFSYFSTQFKKYTGLTPNEWKRQNG